MALVLRPEARHWVAAIKVNGKLCRFPLTKLKDGLEQPIPIEGRRPSSLKQLEEGDRVFMNSYHVALAAHDRLAQELKAKKTELELAEKVLKAKTGKTSKVTKIADLPGIWRRMPRKKKPGEKYLDHGCAVLSRFVKFMEDTDPELQDIFEVDERHLRDFMEKEDKRGLSGRTWNLTLTHLKAVFSREAPSSPAYVDYLRTIPMRDEHTVHRKPFTDQELSAILEAVEKDEILRGPVVTAISTGMRKGDCCSLKWSSVDLTNGFITVQTSKTRETCEIPILPLLRDVLENSDRGEDEVFPEAARLYSDPKKRHLLDTRFAAMMRQVGFDSHGTGKNNGIKDRPGLRKLDSGALLDTIAESVGHSGYQARKKKSLIQVARLYLEGKSVSKVADEAGLSKGAVSLHLNTLEEITGCEILRRPNRPEKRLGDVVEDNGEQRMKRGSVRGWHSFRTTFITRALSAGMPEELVRRVTGHTSVDVVRTHYLRPDREDFRKAFEKVAPRLTLESVDSTQTGDRKGTVLKILNEMNGKTWRKDRERLLQLLAEKPDA